MFVVHRKCKVYVWRWEITSHPLNFHGYKHVACLGGAISNRSKVISVLQRHSLYYIKAILWPQNYHAEIETYFFGLIVVFEDFK